MAIYRVVNEAVSVPVRASMVTGQAATYEESQDTSVLALDRYGRPDVSFTALSRGDYIYTEQADEAKLDEEGASGVYVGASSAVARLTRKGAVVEDDSFDSQSGDEGENPEEAAEQVPSDEDTSKQAPSARTKKASQSK